MAMELWWRAAALEALKALLLSALITTSSVESVKLQRRVAAVLQPTLAVVLASPVLQACLTEGPNNLPQSVCMPIRVHLMKELNAIEPVKLLLLII